MMQGLDFIGRSGGIRTRDPLLPKQRDYSLKSKTYEFFVYTTARYDIWNINNLPK